MCNELMAPFSSTLHQLPLRASKSMGDTRSDAVSSVGNSAYSPPPASLGVTSVYSWITGAMTTHDSTLINYISAFPANVESFHSGLTQQEGVSRTIIQVHRHTCSRFINTELCLSDTVNLLSLPYKRLNLPEWIVVTDNLLLL